MLGYYHKVPPRNPVETIDIQWTFQNHTVVYKEDQTIPVRSSQHLIQALIIEQLDKSKSLLADIPAYTVAWIKSSTVFGLQSP